MDLPLYALTYNYNIIGGNSETVKTLHRDDRSTVHTLILFYRGGLTRSLNMKVKDTTSTKCHQFSSPLHF